VSPPVAIATCDECQAQIAPGLLACPGCARLVHAAELTELGATAQRAEAADDPSAALAAWRRALELLPEGTSQHASVLARINRLAAAVDGRAPAPGATRGKGGAKAVGAGAVGVALLKAKSLLALLLTNGKLLLVGLTKVPTLLSMLIYVHWSSGRGVGFGLGIVASIYVHEVGHVAALRRYGIAASAPMFVPGFGALVRLKQYPASAHEDARTGLAGPVWGLVAALVAAAIGWLGPLPVALAVASWGASINLFNLIPVWQLDGARGLRALSRDQRLMVAAVAGAVAIALHQWMPALVGAVALGRAFSATAPREGDRPVLGWFVLLIVLHALIAALPKGL
jgi:Zn-dependent protease